MSTIFSGLSVFFVLSMLSVCLLMQGLWSPWWRFHFWGLCTAAFNRTCRRRHWSLMKQCYCNVAVFFVTDGRYTDSTWCTAGLCSHLLTSWPRAFWQMFLFCVTCLCICNRACVRESCQPVDTPQQWFSVVAMFVCSCFGVVIECRCCPCCSLLLPQTTLPVVGWSL